MRRSSRILRVFMEKKGGNQRDIDRERAKKRAERNGAKKGKDGVEKLSFQQKKERDAQIMREKQQRKQAAAN